MRLSDRLTKSRDTERNPLLNWLTYVLLHPEVQQALTFRNALGLPEWTGNEDSIYELDIAQVHFFRKAMRTEELPSQQQVLEQKISGSLGKVVGRPIHSNASKVR